MKILITTDTYKPMVNGVVTSVLNLYEQLVKRGHEVRILTLSQNAESRKEEHVYYVGSFALWVYPDARGSFHLKSPFYNEILKWKPDIIHTQSEFVTYAYAKKISKKLMIPMIHTYHTLYEDYTHYFMPSKKLGKKCVAALTRMILKKSSAIVVPTKKVENVLKGYGVKKVMFELPTGIKLDQFESPLSFEERNLMRRGLGIKETDSVLVTVGRIGREKNMDQLIDLMDSLVPYRADLKLLIVGDGPFRNSLEKIVKEKGLEEHIIFTGMVELDKVAAYYQLGDIFVSASTSETQGLTYVEALASGLPAVCKSDECLNGVIQNGYDGYTFDDMDDFLMGITELLDETGTYEQMSENARRKAMDYSIQTFGMNMEKLYQKEILKHHQDEHTFLYAIRRMIA